jgi:tRNA(Ser,Leu) C12 N-acetylase TAN1
MLVYDVQILLAKYEEQVELESKTPEIYDTVSGSLSVFRRTLNITKAIAENGVVKMNAKPNKSMDVRAKQRLSLALSVKP